MSTSSPRASDAAADDVRDGGPHITLDVTNQAEVEAAIRDYDVEVIYHLASILSALAEATGRTRTRSTSTACTTCWRQR